MLKKSHIMKRIIIILSLGIITFSCDSNKSDSQDTAQGLPNIVLLVGDDHGYPYFGFMGADYVQTPNMDQLARSGTLFTNGYVPANHCLPSLQTIITGTLPIDYQQEVNQMIEAQNLNAQDAREFRFHAMKNFQTLPRILKKEGYLSWQGGKWWEFNYQNGGFDYGMTKGWNPEDEGKNDWFLQYMGGDGRQLGRKTMQPVYDFIDNHLNSPMFIWYAPELPHYPLNAPEEYYNIYKDKNLTESAKRYYANCTWFDDGVGQLINHLKEKGEFDNTLFIYVNDNGWEQNPNQEYRHDSLRWHNGGDKGKLSIYDQSFRTPIIFSWKGKINRAVKKDLIHSADISATILDYLNITPSERLYGQSYKNVIDDNSNEARSEIIGRATQIRSEEDMMGRSVEGYWFRNEDWFFKWNLTTREIALYDMKRDSLNNNNVASQNQATVNSLTSKINKWRQDHGTD